MCRSATLIFLLFFNYSLSYSQDPFDQHPGYFGAGYSNGIAWGDYNNDGYQDFFITNGHQSTTDEQNQNLLFLNNSDGTFTQQDSTIGVIASDQFVSGSSTWGDYDNDGFLDLFIADVYRVPAAFPNSYVTTYSLHHNNQDGTFTRSDNHGDLTQPTYECGVIAGWADYNNDGFIDLAISTQFIQFVVYKNFNGLYANNQDNTFSKQSNTFTANETHQGGLSWADFDNDGDQDIVSVAGIENQNSVVYVNTGTDFSTLIIQQNADSRGASWADYDNDGDLDLLLTINGMKRNEGPAPQANCLFQNQGDTLVQVMAGALTTDTHYSNTSAWADYDNDGDLDVFIGNSGEESPVHLSYLYENDGQGSFNRLNNPVLNDSSQFVRAAAWADFDNDGDLDLALARDGVNRLFFNNLENGAHYLEIKLNGITGNRSGIGSQIRVKTTIAGQSTWQLRDISAQTGFASQNSLVAHFGLGDATLIDSIIIDWAGSEAMDILTDVPVDQLLEITENQYSSVQQTQTIQPQNFKLYQNYPNPFNPITVINYDLPKSDHGTGITNFVEIVVYNALGQKVKTIVKQKMPAGHHSVTFDGSAFTSGLYYYRISYGKYQLVKKMLLLK